MADPSLGVHHFRNLRSSLTQLVQGNARDLHALRLQLEKSKQAFKTLLQERPQNAAEKKELDDFHFTPLGSTKRRAIDQTFKSEALFLSSELKISERLAASLLYAAQTGHGPNPDRAQAENAVLIFHERRRDLLVSLITLFSVLSDLTVLQALDQSTQNYLVQYAGDLVTARHDNDAATSWIKRIMNEVDSAWKTVERLKGGNAHPSVGDYSGGPTAQFGEAINAVQIQSYREERAALVSVIYYAASSRFLSQEDILAVIRWSAGQRDAAAEDTLAISLTSILAIININSLEPDSLLRFASEQNQARRSGSASNEPFSASFKILLTDTKLLRDLHSFIKTAVNWKNPIQPVVQLAWGLFLIQTFRNRPEIAAEVNLPAGDGDVDSSVSTAIRTGAFEFLSNSLLRFKKPTDPYEELGWNAGTKEEAGDITHLKIEPEFRDSVIKQVDSLLEALFTNGLRILKRIKGNEEDARDARILTSSRGGVPPRRRSRSFSRSTAGNDNAGTSSTAEPRHDIESLCSLVATLYREAPDAALKYWLQNDSDLQFAAGRGVSRVSGLIRWIEDFKDFGNMPRTFFDMLGSLATGQESASFAFEMLLQNSSNGQDGRTSPASWTALFQALSYYGSLRPQDGPVELPPEEITLLKSFLRLLKIVVSYSSRARSLLYDNQRYKPVTTLFTFIASGTAIDLKAAALEAVAAFTAPPSKEDGPGMAAMAVEIAKRAWTILEGSQFLPTIPQRDARGFLLRPDLVQEGIVRDLEELESSFRVYSATTAFVTLLVSMLGGTEDLERPGITESSAATADSAAAMRAIPDNLGAPHRSPADGVAAYTRFVIDDVLLKAGTRAYRNANERWRITEKCLAYTERCLANLSLDTFLEAAATGQALFDAKNTSASPAYQLLIAPGFDILVRILNGSKLLTELLTLSSMDLEVLDDEDAASIPFVHTVLRALRILNRVFALQAPFLEVILPTLIESSSALSAEKLRSFRSVLPLDQHLLYDTRDKSRDKTHVVVKIAVLVSCIRSKAIGLAVIRLLGHLASSATFTMADQFSDFYRSKVNRLAGLVDASDETVRLRDGFVRRLAGDDRFEEVVASSLQDIESTSAPEYDVDAAIKLAIFDLLLAGTVPSCQAPNLAHLLLGCDIRARAEDLEIPDHVSSCLHVVLEYLARIRADAGDGDTEINLPNLLIEDPKLAEKSYQLIKQLCLQEYTSQAVIRYLRLADNYFLLQSGILPLEFPTTEQHEAENMGTLTSSDGTEIRSSPAAVVATLHCQAYLLESLALEVNGLVNNELHERALQLLSALFDPYSSSSETVDGFGGRRNAHQSLPRMLDVFYTADFNWTDAVSINETPINFYANLNFDGCLRRTSTGCIIYDFDAVLSLLQRARRSLQDRGMLSTQQQQDELREERRAILENLIIENNRREIQHARLHTLSAWRQVLDITLSRAWHLMPSSVSAPLILDLLLAVVPPICAQGSDAELQDILAGAAVLLMARVRQETLQQQSSSVQAPQSLAPERLLPILQAILRAIVEQGLPPMVRGNLYATLLHYIQHCHTVSSNSRRSWNKDSAVSISLSEVTDTPAEDTFTLDGASTLGGSKRFGKRGPLESGNLSVLQASLDRMLPVICLDAAAGDDVWQTVAFSVLNAICLVAGEGGGGGKLAMTFFKQGYLQTFVSSLKEREPDIVDVLQPDPESLNAFYVYEAKTAFLTRIASTREGAERLLDAQILLKLGQCSFLDGNGSMSTDGMDYDTFLPPVAQRQTHIVLQALQLALAIATSCSSHNVGAARQVLSFLNEQGEAMRAILELAAYAPTVVGLKQAKLLTNLMSYALPAVADEELSKPTGFGGLHTSIVTLSSVLLSGPDWMAAIQPTSEEELVENERLASGFGRRASAFDELALSQVELLQISVLEYMKCTTKRPSSTIFRPVWQPNFQLDDQKRSRSAISPPDLRGAFVFLLDTAQTLKERLEEGIELQFKLENFDDLGIDDLNAIAAVDEMDDVLDQQDRRERLRSILVAEKSGTQTRLLTSLHLLEVTLLLTWRHLAHYLEQSRQQDISSPGRPGANDVTPYRPQPLRKPAELADLQKNAQNAFHLVSNSLEEVALEKAAVGIDLRSHTALLSSLVRSILDLVGEKGERPT